MTNGDNVPSFKYKASLIGNTENNRTKMELNNSCTIKICK